MRLSDYHVLFPFDVISPRAAPCSVLAGIVCKQLKKNECQMHEVVKRYVHIRNKFVTLENTQSEMNLAPCNTIH